MASGHVNRIYRPNTWLHRPMLQNVKKALANSEPSTHGTKRTWRDVRHESAFGGKAENIYSERVFRLLTQTDMDASPGNAGGPSFLECLATQSHDRLPQGQGRVLTKDHGAKAMATQIVMDHTGDTRHYFNSHDREAVAKAEERFRKLTGAGFTVGCPHCHR